MFPNTHIHSLEEFQYLYYKVIEDESLMLRHYVDKWFECRENLKKDPLYKEVNSLVCKTMFLVPKFEKKFKKKYK